MEVLQVIHSAPSMQFQDLGRFGHTHLGITQGGPLDIHAHCWANYLLGNEPNSTTLEISYGNCSFLALTNCLIALTGAVKNWHTHQLEKGDTLQLSYASKGIHAYLAIYQGFTTKNILNSSSTVIRNNIGTLLKANDTLHSPTQHSLITNQKSTPAQFIQQYSSEVKIRVIQPTSELLNNAFTISPHSDRMGINLIAPQPLPTSPGIISEGIPLGSIQLPPSGNPIILLNDRQTQGGYAKIGTIARVDLPLLTQLRPNSSIQFAPISIEQASTEWATFADFFGL